MACPVPSVDVVVLSLNRTDDTLECLRSVLAQREVSVRLWVVDQGSRREHLDDLRTFAASHGETRLIELGENVGVPAGRNVGIYAGDAEWVVCIDNDAILASPLGIAGALALLNESPEVAAVGFRADDYFTGGLDMTSWVYPPGLMTRRDPTLVARFVGVGHALRRSAFEQVGGYDDHLFFCEEELDLSYKLIGAGYSIVYAPSIVVLHKVSQEARMGWDDRRVYYQTRNAVLVRHRHYRRLPTSLLIAAGWLAIATRNGRAREASRGLRDALRMWRTERHDPPLGREGRRYIRDHDTRLRGSLSNRLRLEVLAELPRPVRAGR